MSEPAFTPGDRVAWHHSYASQFPSGVVVFSSAVPQHPDSNEAGGGQFGSVQDVANEVGTHFSVLLDGRDEPLILTMDELVKIQEPNE